MFDSTHFLRLLCLYEQIDKTMEIYNNLTPHVRVHLLFKFRLSSAFVFCSQWKILVPDKFEFVCVYISYTILFTCLCNAPLTVKTNQRRPHCDRPLEKERT